MPQQPQQIEFEGQVHEFPSDFTDTDIQKALGSHSPAPQAPTQGVSPATAFTIPSPGLGNKEVVGPKHNWTEEGYQQAASQGSPLLLQRPGILQNAQKGFLGEGAKLRQDALNQGYSPLHAAWNEAWTGLGADAVGMVGQPVESLKSGAITAAASTPYVRAAIAPYLAYQGYKMMTEPPQPGETPANHLQRALLGGSMVVGTAAHVGKTMPKEITAVTDLYRRANSLSDISKAGTGLYQGKIQNTINTLRGAIQNEGARTIQQAIEADKMADPKGDGSISGASVVAEVQKAIEDTGHEPTAATRALLSRLNTDPADQIAQGLGYPNADLAKGKMGQAAFESYANNVKQSAGLGGTGLTLEDAKNLRSDIGSAAAKAERTGNAKLASILWRGYGELGEGMAKRVEELQGSRKPYDHYNNEFKAFYELNKGVTGSMMERIADRHEVMPKLKEFATADLTELKDQARKYRLNPSDIDSMQKDAKALVAASDSLNGKFSKSVYRLAMSSPRHALLPLGILMAAKGAGLYGFAPYLLATMVGSTENSVAPTIEAGRILRKLNVKLPKEAFQVRTPVEGPQAFNYQDPSAKAQAVSAIKAAK